MMLLVIVGLALTMPNRPQKITFAEMRAAGVIHPRQGYCMRHARLAEQFRFDSGQVHFAAMDTLAEIGAAHFLDSAAHQPAPATVRALQAHVR